jgi:hypothetical protein
MKSETIGLIIIWSDHDFKSFNEPEAANFHLEKGSPANRPLYYLTPLSL